MLIIDQFLLRLRWRNFAISLILASERFTDNDAKSLGFFWPIVLFTNACLG
jgi:hypothetical protein